MTYLLGQWGMHVKCRTNIKTQTQSYKGFKYRTFETGLWQPQFSGVLCGDVEFAELPS